MEKEKEVFSEFDDVLKDGEKGPKELEYEATVEKSFEAKDPQAVKKLMQKNIDEYVGRYKDYAKVIGEATGGKAAMDMEVGFNKNGSPILGKISYDPALQNFEIQENNGHVLSRTELDQRFKDVLNESPQLLTEYMDRNAPEQRFVRSSYEFGHENSSKVTLNMGNGSSKDILYDAGMSSSKQERLAAQIKKNGLSNIEVSDYKNKNPIQGTKLEKLGNWCCRHPGMTIGFIGAVAMGKGIGQLAMRVAMMGAQYVGDMSKQSANAAVR